MTEAWIDTKTEYENAKRIADFWEALRSDLDAGVFWADRIQQYKNEPRQRLAIALENLPLPAAFREGAVAIRALIREKRKNKQDFEEELTFLYWLAAVRSFIIDYAPKLKEPGFNVVQSIPGEKIRSLPFTYSSLGFKKLELLNKTDCKWLVEMWGEPLEHSTLHELHKDLWKEYEERLVQQRIKEADHLWADLIGDRS